MRKEIVEQWDKNKGRLENYFRTTKQSEYDEYLKLIKVILTNVLTDKEYMLERITEINDGDYQGTLLYVIPEETYQPIETEYLFTSVEYGSCSGCDALEGISNYDSGLPSKHQVDEYMKLSLHIIQKMRKYMDFN